MRRNLVSILILTIAVQIYAQDDTEYRMEIGAGTGLVSYEGDFNGNIFKNMQPCGSLLWRYVLNPRMALRAMGSYGKLKGSSKGTTTYYPAIPNEAYSFDHAMGDLNATFEYNFWPYGTGRDYRGAKRLTPFVFGGIGIVYANGSSKSVFAGQLPMGLGIKYKFGDRLNVGLEWSVHFSLSDELDGMKDPYQINSSGMFKNTDCYSALLITLSYSFKAKCRTCHNADE